MKLVLVSLALAAMTGASTAANAEWVYDEEETAAYTVGDDLTPDHEHKLVAHCFDGEEMVVLYHVPPPSMDPQLEGKTKGYIVFRIDNGTADAANFSFPSKIDTDSIDTLVGIGGPDGMKVARAIFHAKADIQVGISLKKPTKDSPLLSPQHFPTEAAAENLGKAILACQ